MHSVLSIASLFLAASGALAYPQQASNMTSTSYLTGTQVKVTLTSQNAESKEILFERVDAMESKQVHHGGEFSKILVEVGKDAKQDLRCQALDERNIPLIGLRNANVDVTFSDAHKGAWNFTNPYSQVSRIVCDPAFVASESPEDFDIRVELASKADDLATQTVLKAFDGLQASEPIGSFGPYDSVTISVGKQLNPTLRCQLIDRRGKKILATRGEEPNVNVDTTFSDAGKGEWVFRRQHRVVNIVCDETFKAAPQ